MEYVLAIDGKSPFGAFLLSLKNKIGGASGWIEQANESHPVVIAKDLDWGLLPAFVRMTHIRNPEAEDRQLTELVVPAAIVLAVMPKAAPADQPRAEQQKQPSPLH